MSKGKITLTSIRQFVSRFRFDRQVEDSRNGVARSIWPRKQPDDAITTAKSLSTPQNVRMSVEVHSPFISIVPLGMRPSDIQGLEQAIARTFQVSTQIAPALPSSFAFDSSRNQYNSTSILTRLLENPPEGIFKILGVTNVDLFIPILTFVFGEAQLNGLAAVVSTYRMRNEFYGLPKDEKVLQSRFIKEAVHEIGHTFGLSHCSDDACVMHISTYAEEIDLKSDAFCTSCDEFITAVLSDKKRDAGAVGET